MTNDDEKLKYKIISDVHPKLSKDFSRKTLDSIFIKASKLRSGKWEKSTRQEDFQWSLGVYDRFARRYPRWKGRR